MPNGTTTAVQHPPKAHLGLPTTSWLRPSRFDKTQLSVRWAMIMSNKSWSVSSRPKIITATDGAILGMLYVNRALTDPTSSQTRTTRHTSNCTCNLRKTDHTRNGYSSTIATSKTTASTPDKLCSHSALAMNCQRWLRQALSALNARNSKSEKPEKNRKSATQNLEYLPKSQYVASQTQSIPLHERPLQLRL